MYKEISFNWKNTSEALKYVKIERKLFFLLMSVLFKSFFTLMRSHFMSLSFLTAWHNSLIYVLIMFFSISIFYFTFFLTLSTKDLEGLKAGIKCSGMIIVVFLEIFLPVF